MASTEYQELQKRYGGYYLARRNSEIIASAETYDELDDQLETIGVDWGQIVIEYVEPATVVGVY